MKFMLFSICLAVLSQCSGNQPEVVNEPPQLAAAPKKTEQRTVVRIGDKDSTHHHNHFVAPDTLELDSVMVDSLAAVPDSMQLRILSIGNSFARDAFSYVPFILQELLPGLDLHLTIMYYPGRPLRDQWHAYQNVIPEYQRDTYTTEQGMWHTEKQHPLTPELDSLRHWDLIVFQQASGSSPFYETYQPYLHNLISVARSNVPGAKVGWLLTPSHPDGYAKMPTTSSNDMWQLICDAAEKVARDERVDVIFPGGTAIQNARQTHLDSLGNFGHMSADGLHLQDGIPCLVEALTIAQKILNMYNIPLSISASTLHPTQRWATERKIPEMNGVALEGSDDDYALCKRIALRAVANPYTLYVKVLPQTVVEEQQDSIQINENK